MVRIKKRYLAVRLERRQDVLKSSLARSKVPPLSFNGGQLLKSLREQLERLHGDYGRATASAGLRVIYLNGSTGVALICCRHGPHRLVASTLPFLCDVGSEKVLSTLMYTGATIRHTYKVGNQF